MTGIPGHINYSILGKLGHDMGAVAMYGIVGYLPDTLLGIRNVTC